MRPTDEITKDTNHNKLKAILADEKKRQQHIAENNKTFINWIIQREKKK
jgi:hypothetical protein